jgi:hypothetical protein
VGCASGCPKREIARLAQKREAFNRKDRKRGSAKGAKRSFEKCDKTRIPSKQKNLRELCESFAIFAVKGF